MINWDRVSKSHVRTVLAAVVGALAGGAYAKFVGCRTGTCLITSSVWTASLYGALLAATAAWPPRKRAAQPAAGPGAEPGVDLDDRG